VKHRRILLALLPLCLFGCTRLFGPSKVLTVAVPQEPITLDWPLVRDPASHLILAQMQRGLLKLESIAQPISDLAEGWSMDITGKNYTFVLSRDRWSDGVDLTTGDFVFAWKRMLSPETPDSPALRALLKIAGARDFHSGKLTDFSKVGIRAVTPIVLEVVLETKDKDFAVAIATPVLGPQRQDVYELHPTDFTSPLHLRTIGPYLILEWEKGKSLLLVSNSYSSIKPSVAKVRFEFLAEPLAKELFDHGKLDVLSPPPGTMQFIHGTKVGGVPLDAAGMPLFSQVEWK
jgi:ABC-type oligopeptide transport system substrate-binding subunit